MAGTVDPRLSRAESQGFRVERATPADDPLLRRLLRARPLEGEVRLTLEREPSFWRAQAIEGDRHYTIVIRNVMTGDIVGMGSRSVREVWVNGKRARLGYLSALRAAPGLGGLAYLLAGYREVEVTRCADEIPFDLTSVVADNSVARRLLERGLPGLPQYHPLCNYRTLLIPVGRRRQLRGRQLDVTTPEDLGEIAHFLGRSLRRYQFAPVWSEGILRSRERCPDLCATDFMLMREGGQIVGCAACWDQRRFKQVVVRGYASCLARFRPALNLVFWLGGHPRLPPVGAELSLAYISHLAVEGDRVELALALIDALRQRCASRDVEVLAVGFAIDHPLLSCLEQHYPTRSYESVLYRVEWPGAPEFALDERVPHVEVATL